MVTIDTATRQPPTNALGAMTGERYIRSLKDGREIWIDGERVADVTTHPAFKLMIGELARVYDLQNSAEYRDEMTFVDAETGIRTSLSWLLPRSADDLKRKRRNSELWNRFTWGQLGRSPDILAPYIISALHLKDEFSAVKHPKCDFGENLENYYRHCMRNDLFLTHALGDPQVDRSEQPQNERRAVREDEEIALHVVEETGAGVIVSPAASSCRPPRRTATNAMSLCRPRSHTAMIRSACSHLRSRRIRRGSRFWRASRSRAGSARGDTRCRCSTSRIACCSSTASWSRGTGCSCSTIRRRW